MNHSDSEFQSGKPSLPHPPPLTLHKECTMAHDIYDTLLTSAETNGVDAMLEVLANNLATQERWHALFDVRLIQNRLAIGLSPVGDTGTIDSATRDKLDNASLKACREVGWPLLDRGDVAEAWMYLRASCDASEVATRLSALVDRPECAEGIVRVALWEGVDPALGLSVVLRDQGTCSGITAFDQASGHISTAHREGAIEVLINHIHRELQNAIAADMARRGRETSPNDSIPQLLALVEDIHKDSGFHLDVSHLASVMRIARPSTHPITLSKSWELAMYGRRLPADLCYAGESPFEDLYKASCLWFGAQIGKENIDHALEYFSTIESATSPAEEGTYPLEVIVTLLHRVGRSQEALDIMLKRLPENTPTSGLLPSVVLLAQAAHAYESLRNICRQRGDEVTFATTLVLEKSPR